MDSTLGFVLSGLVVGALFGFVLQRGRYCVNTAFRDIIFINDFTLFRAYVLGLLVLIIGANFIEDMGWLGGSGELYRQAFVPWANVIGGYIFGMGIVLAGGCGSGILYRVGEGLTAAIMAVFGFFFGITTTRSGILKPVDELLKSKAVYLGPDNDITPTLYNIIGVNKWIVIAVIAVVAIPFLLKGEPFKKAKKGYYWSTAGLLSGLVGVLAFWASAYWGGNARGLSFTGPLREFFFAVALGDSQTNQIATKTILGANFSWSSLYVIGVPLGGFISAKLLQEFKLKVPPAEELMRVLLGGFVMGIGAQIGGGCNIGQGFTGVSTLAVSSWVTTIFIILGNWTMVYFLLIKPMKE